MKNYKRMNMVFLLLLLCYLGGSVCVGFFAPFLADTTLKASALSYILLLLVPTIYCVKYNVDVQKKYLIKPVTVSTLLIAALFVALCYPLITVANIASQLVVSNEATALMDSILGPNMVVNVLVIAILPGIVEEVIFRGMFYNEYKEGGMFLGAIASSLLFGLLHLNFNQFSYAIILGFVFALVTEATGSIIPSMICHMSINALNMLMVYGYSVMGISIEDVEITTDQIVLTLAAWSFIAAICTVGAVGVYIWLLKHTGRLSHMKGFMKAESGRRITLPLVIAVGICVAYMIYYG
ncbi:MAG: CPBP family intramembrane metalloprotease [Eubacterium sp.]|nr:CPBP family intramembrane metalloprotease [Eubacterium sp.]